MPPNKKQARTSAHICRDLGIVDIELTYSAADYRNMTSFALFSRMIKPQLTQVSHYLHNSFQSINNPNISALVFSQLHALLLLTLNPIPTHLDFTFKTCSNLQSTLNPIPTYSDLNFRICSNLQLIVLMNRNIN